MVAIVANMIFLIIEGFFIIFLFYNKFYTMMNHSYKTPACNTHKVSLNFLYL